MRDFHVHTSLCKHADGEMAEYVEVAIAKGFREICFTDHIPLPKEFDAGHRMGLCEMERYLNGIDSMREAYPEISILTGIEADYIEGCESFLEVFLSQYPFDLVIMSIHFVKNWRNGNWVFSFHFPDKPLHLGYTEYLQAIQKGIKTGLFDIVGHLDLIKRKGHPLLETNRQEVEILIDLIKRHQMSLEVNTSGLRKDIGEIYPHADIIQMVVKSGIPLVLASDCHSPWQLGFRFPEIGTWLSEFSYLRMATYRKRKQRIIEWDQW